MTYGGKNYLDVITVEDKSDPYVSEMLSIGGYTVKNNLGGVVPYVIVRTNQKEVDSLLGSISETAPSAPKSGDFWYKIDHTEKNFKLGSYSNTTSSSASSISYAIPVSWCNAVTDDIIGAASITGQVLFGGKVYKKFTANLTVSVPDTVIPSISSVTFSDVDDSAVPSSWGIYVQGQSGLKLKSISCTGAYGSEIKKVKMTADSRIRTTDYPELPEMDHISQSGEVSVMVTVTDSRNRTVNKSAVVSVVSYLIFCILIKLIQRHWQHLSFIFLFACSLSLLVLAPQRPHVFQILLLRCRNHDGTNCAMSNLCPHRIG